MTRVVRPEGGLYLVVDPAGGAGEVLPKVEAALDGGVNVLQIWNHWAADAGAAEAAAFVDAALALARPRGVPVLVHDDPELLEVTDADGIHFDEPALTPAAVRSRVKRDVVYGVTCGNDLERVRWAGRTGADYVSFCSLFPSPSAGACELVEPATIERARAAHCVTLFASGGITPANAGAALAAGAHGLAVISGILSAEDPAAAASAYARVLREHRARAG